MKISYLINGMYNSAGMERVVANKANFLTARGHEITIITSSQNNRPFFYGIPDEVKRIDFGINTFDYEGKTILFKVYSFLKKEKLFKFRLSKFLLESPQDVIVVLEDRFIPAVIEVSSNHTIIVAESHFNKFAFKEIGKSVNRNCIQRIVYNLRSSYLQYRYRKKLDAMVLLTHEDLSYYKQHNANLFVIPNSVDYVDSKKANLNNKIVIAVGRLTYQKGFERLIESWSLIHNECPDWRLQIYGDGEDRHKLESLIKQYDLQNSISLYHSTPQIESKLLQSSVYVLSSRFEGLPMVMIEAMSLGLPLVAFDCKTGPKDLIKDGFNGYLVREGDVQDLALKILKMIRDDDLRKRIGANAKQEAKKYSHDKIAICWESLFNDLLEKKR